MSHVGAVLMAAGAGRRIGCRPKSLLMRDGMSLLERQLRAMAGAGVTRAVVVLGHHAARIEQVLQSLPNPLESSLRLNWVRNDHPDVGPGSSLRAGLAALPRDLDAVLVSLADQPLLTAGDVQSVLSAWADKPDSCRLVVPQYRGQPGHPLMLDAQVRQAIEQMEGGAGVREWRRSHAEEVYWMRVGHARHTLDIDSEADREQLALEHSVALAWPDDLRLPMGSGDFGVA